MTQDEIIRMAREAGLICESRPVTAWIESTDLTPYLTRFAAIVAAHANQEYIDSVYEQHRETMFSNKDLGMLVDAVKAEREACAKVCDELKATYELDGLNGTKSYHEAAAAIRARGE